MCERKGYELVHGELVERLNKVVEYLNEMQTAEEHPLCLEVRQQIALAYNDTVMPRLEMFLDSLAISDMLLVVMHAVEESKPTPPPFDPKKN